MALNLLRIVLAWEIVLVHCFYLTANRFQLTPAPALFGFMLLSGYVMTKMIRSRPEPYDVYLFRRFMRLFPVFFVCLLLALIARPFLLELHAPIKHLPGELAVRASEALNPWGLFLAHLTMLHGPLSVFLPHAADSLLPPAWYVSIQWQFCLVAPILVWLLQRYGRYAVVLLLAIALVPYLKLYLYERYVAGNYTLWDWFLPYLLGILIALRSGAIGPSGKAFGHTAAASTYSLYLVHYPLLNLLLVGFHIRSPWILFAVGAPLALVASLALYFRVEQPCIELSRQIKSVKKLLIFA